MTPKLLERGIGIVSLLFAEMEKTVGGVGFSVGACRGHVVFGMLSEQ